ESGGFADSTAGGWFLGSRRLRFERGDVSIDLPAEGDGEPGYRGKTPAPGWGPDSDPPGRTGGCARLQYAYAVRGEAGVAVVAQPSGTDVAGGVGDGGGGAKAADGDHSAPRWADLSHRTDGGGEDHQSVRHFAR